MEQIISRQFAISEGNAEPLPLPDYDTYAICNLRGGIGKSSLCFNLSYLTDNVLMVDTCPQGNLSYFYDNQYFSRNTSTVYDLILPHIMPGLGTAARVAQSISATNEHFKDKNSFFIPSSEMMYLLPNQVAVALSQAQSIPQADVRTKMQDAILYSLKSEILREKAETDCSRCLIDTSPFFSGGTHLVWHSTDALIVPVRTDQQSINSLNLLLKLFSSPASEFRRCMPSDGHMPKIQMVVLTHCGWSTRAGGECQDFCVWGGYSRGSPTRLPFVFEMQYARPDAIAGAKVEGPARSAGGSSLAPAIARREAAGALAREV